MKAQVTMIDYGRSNLLSVQRALEHCGATVVYAYNEKEVLQADALVLPGVGAFDDGMRLLRESGMAQAICEKAQKGTPLFGICLGLQMLFEHSAEGGKEDEGQHKALRQPAREQEGPGGKGAETQQPQPYIRRRVQQGPECRCKYQEYEDRRDAAYQLFRQCPEPHGLYLQQPVRDDYSRPPAKAQVRLT